MNLSSDDDILDYIETEWGKKSLEKDNKSCAKLLRLLVNHVKTAEGIPIHHQKGVREKIQFLLSGLETMELDAAAQCVSSIDHARSRLDANHDFGAGLRAKLGANEKRSIRKNYKRLKLRPECPIPE